MNNNIYRIDFLTEGRNGFEVDYNFFIDEYQKDVFEPMFLQESRLKGCYIINKELLDYTKRIGWQPAMYPEHVADFLCRIYRVETVDLYDMMKNGKY